MDAETDTEDDVAARAKVLASAGGRNENLTVAIKNELASDVEAEIRVVVRVVDDTSAEVEGQVSERA